MYKKKEDRVIFPWLGNNLQKGKTILDVGARRAVWYRHIAEYFPTEEAHLFEPTNAMRKVKDFHQVYPNATIHRVALSDVEGELDFHIDLEKASWSGLVKQKDDGKYKTIKVPVKTIDSYRFKNVGLIKIDVEGNELFTMRGAFKTLQEFKPIIYFECADVHMKNYKYTSGDIWDYLTNLGYDILDLDLNVCSREKLLEHTASEPSFYHNFIAR